MNDVLIELIRNPRTQMLVFIFLMSLVVLPCYFSYRVEQAVVVLTSKIECGNKYVISDITRR